MNNRIVRIFVLAASIAVAPISLFAAVRGVVIDESGHPIRGARATLYAPESSTGRMARWMSDSPERIPLARSVASSSGEFAADVRQASIADLVLEADGFAPVMLRVSGEEEVGAVLMRPVAMTVGRVTSGASAVAGARVVWSSDDGLELISTTRSDGRYETPNPALWAARRIILHPSYSVRDGRRRRGPATMDADLDPGAVVEGVVVTRNGASVSGATILVDGLPLSLSAADGRFRIEHVSAGSAVSAIAEGAMGEFLDGTIRLERAGSVAGVLVADGATGKVCGSGRWRPA